MDTKITFTTELGEGISVILICKDIKNIIDFSFTKEETDFIKNANSNKLKSICVNQYNRFVFIEILDGSQEDARKAANKLHPRICKHKIGDIIIKNTTDDHDNALAFAEGLALSNYQFLKYFKDKKEKKNSLRSIHLNWDGAKQEVVDLQASIDGTFIARELVNEPLSYLTAMQYSQDIEAMGKEAGFSVEVFHKKKIESLRMGGLLAVNKGSIDPPTFSIMEWKPKNASNKKPIVLVGKGIVYDTGGLSLKPTGNSMDMMKCDMGGSAAVVGTMYAIAKAKLNVHVVGLVPATDNRPSGNAYAPGDVITMYDGTSVEVLNTDAEGRLVMADALTYAKKYDPEFVIDLATLTGAAARAIGKQGIVAMGNDSSTMSALKISGDNVHERIAEFPFWDEYSEDLKSSIADLKNLGGPEGGAITAGKFLEHFTDYPYTHLDIAGPAFTLSPFNYKGHGGTGVGVRLLFDFFKHKSA